MEDLNDLVLFAAVVTHGSFSGAARALGIPKSRVSRRVADLEQRLGCGCCSVRHGRCTSPTWDRRSTRSAR